MKQIILEWNCWELKVRQDLILKKLKSHKCNITKLELNHQLGMTIKMINYIKEKRYWVNL